MADKVPQQLDQLRSFVHPADITLNQEALFALLLLQISNTIKTLRLCSSCQQQKVGKRMTVHQSRPRRKRIGHI